MRTKRNRRLMMKRFPLRSAVLFFAFAVSASLHAETNELRIAKQPGLLYLPTIVMEENKLIEKHAAAMGLKDFKMSWLAFTSGGASTDALLSGNVDMVVSGVTNLLLLWGKTNGAVKGISGVGSASMMLVTRNPNIKTLSDFTGQDKIAVPTVKVSMQATVLQIAAEKQFGPAGLDRVNAMTVAMGHPDAMIALQNSNEQITSHFSLPPYQAAELKMPGVREVLNSNDVMGGPVSNAVVFGLVKFHDANPKVIAAFLAALDEAIALIARDKQAAVEIYQRATKDKTPAAELVQMLAPPAIVYSTTPMQTMKIADFMARSGYVKPRPNDWKDFFFSELHRLPGT
jgi:NitT/TauT family transport system substrate-binding protein